GTLVLAGNGYLQTGGSLYAKGSTTDDITAVGAIKFNGGNVFMGDGSNTYNFLRITTSSDTYIDGATFNFKVNAATSGMSDRLQIAKGTLHIDTNGGRSNMQWTINGIVGAGSWTVITADSGNAIDGDFTTKNIPVGFTETKNSSWILNHN
ncbi:MAG TPA: hypothetical protein VKE94_06745, partial [Gemmataceae bacterium]|nr:hypothetical protein [Gemmataceae bacterium]